MNIYENKLPRGVGHLLRIYNGDRCYTLMLSGKCFAVSGEMLPILYKRMIMLWYHMCYIGISVLEGTASRRTFDRYPQCRHIVDGNLVKLFIEQVAYSELFVFADTWILHRYGQQLYNSMLPCVLTQKPRRLNCTKTTIISFLLPRSLALMKTIPLHVRSECTVDCSSRVLA